MMTETPKAPRRRPPAAPPMRDVTNVVHAIDAQELGKDVQQRVVHLERENILLHRRLKEALLAVSNQKNQFEVREQFLLDEIKKLERTCNALQQQCSVSLKESLSNNLMMEDVGSHTTESKELDRYSGASQLMELRDSEVGQLVNEFEQFCLEGCSSDSPAINSIVSLECVENESFSQDFERFNDASNNQEQIADGATFDHQVQEKTCPEADVVDMLLALNESPSTSLAVNLSSNEQESCSTQIECDGSETAEACCDTSIERIASEDSAYCLTSLDPSATSEESECCFTSIERSASEDNETCDTSVESDFGAIELKANSDVSLKKEDEIAQNGYPTVSAIASVSEACNTNSADSLSHDSKMGVPIVSGCQTDLEADEIRVCVSETHKTEEIELSNPEQATDINNTDNIHPNQVKYVEDDIYSQTDALAEDANVITDTEATTENHSNKNSCDQDIEMTTIVAVDEVMLNPKGESYTTESHQCSSDSVSTDKLSSAVLLVDDGCQMKLDNCQVNDAAASSEVIEHHESSGSSLARKRTNEALVLKNVAETSELEMISSMPVRMTRNRRKSLGLQLPGVMNCSSNVDFRSTLQCAEEPIASEQDSEDNSEESEGGDAFIDKSECTTTINTEVYKGDKLNNDILAIDGNPQNNSDCEDNFQSNSDGEDSFQNNSDCEDSFQNNSDGEDSFQNNSDCEDSFQNNSDGEDNLQNNSDGEDNLQNNSDGEHNNNNIIESPESIESKPVTRRSRRRHSIGAGLLLSKKVTDWADDDAAEAALREKESAEVGLFQRRKTRQQQRMQTKESSLPETAKTENTTLEKKEFSNRKSSQTLQQVFEECFVASRESEAASWLLFDQMERLNGMLSKMLPMVDEDVPKTRKKRGKASKTKRGVKPSSSKRIQWSTIDSSTINPPNADEETSTMTTQQVVQALLAMLNQAELVAHEIAQHESTRSTWREYRDKIAVHGYVQKKFLLELCDLMLKPKTVERNELPFYARSIELLDSLFRCSLRRILNNEPRRIALKPFELSGGGKRTAAASSGLGGTGGNLVWTDNDDNVPACLHFALEYVNEYWNTALGDDSAVVTDNITADFAKEMVLGLMAFDSARKLVANIVEWTVDDAFNQTKEWQQIAELCELLRKVEREHVNCTTQCYMLLQSPTSLVETLRECDDKVESRIDQWLGYWRESGAGRVTKSTLKTMRESVAFPQPYLL